MIRIKEEFLERIFEHCKEGYPHEVCGILIGKCDGDNKEVFDVVRANNLNSERAHDRYELDPKVLLKAEREGGKRGLEVIGFYHSHPDHPDAPSEHDRERAWPIYSYMIVSVMKGTDVSFRSWVLNGDTEKFEEEKIS